MAMQNLVIPYITCREVCPREHGRAGKLAKELSHQGSLGNVPLACTQTEG